MAHRKKKIPAQLAEDEEYQLRHERVAGAGIAKDKGDVAVRLPAAREGRRRRSRAVENVPARSRDILELGAQLLAMEAVPAAWGVSAAGEPSPDPGPGAAVLPASPGSRRSPASPPTSPARSSPEQART